MAQVPGEGHPDRWLYESLLRIEGLLFVIATRQYGEQSGEPEDIAQAILAESQQIAALRHLLKD
jgi:hypothetical protein